MISFKEFLLEDQNDNNNNKVLSIIKNNPTKTKIINTYYERLKNIFTFKDNDKTIIYYNNILWCLQYLEQNLNNIEAFDKFIEEINHYQLYIPKVEFKNQKPEDIIAKLKKFYDEAKAKEEKNKGITPQKNDEILIKCKSGNSWWFVDRAYCPEEGRSGNHCGNVVGQQKPDQRILSLRNSANQVILTFILEPDNTLGEMKMRGNHKPSKEYHKQIMSLLKSDGFKIKNKSGKVIREFQISGISGRGYLPHMNFSMFDLSEEDLLDIHKHNNKFIIDQIKITPTEILRSFDKIKQLYKNKVNPQIKNLINNPSAENWNKIITKSKKLIIYVPQEFWLEIPNFKEKLIDELVSSKDALLKAPQVISKDFDILKEVISLEPNKIRLIQNTYKHYDDLLIIAISKNSDILYDISKENISKKIAKIILDDYPKYFGMVPKEYIPKDYKIDLKDKKDLIFKIGSISSLIGICPEKIPRNFKCAGNSQLTSLEGCPKIIGKNFKIYINKLKSLKYGPIEVGGDYDCFGNQLSSLEYCPNKIKGDFNCSDNQLTSLEYSPNKIKGDFNCSNNQLTSLEYSPKEVGGSYLCSDNQLTSLEYSPNIINGAFDCSNNKLESLEHAPKEVKGNFYCSENTKKFTIEDVRKVCNVGDNIYV